MAGSAGAEEPATDGPIGPIGRDPAAFAEFYRRHVDEVTRFVARRVADPHLAADLTAEVFLQVIQAADATVEVRGGPRAWLFGIARHVIASEFRRVARERRTQRRIAGRRLLDADDITRLEQQIDAARQARRLYAELEGLADQQRAVLELVAVDGLTLTEAAAALGIRPVTARVRLHRARRRLRGPITPSAPRPQTPIDIAPREVPR